MLYLIIQFINFTDFKSMGFPVYHKSNSWIRGDGYMYSVSYMKRLVTINMRFMTPPETSLAAIALITVPPGG